MDKDKRAAAAAQGDKPSKSKNQKGTGTANGQNGSTNSNNTIIKKKKFATSLTEPVNKQTTLAAATTSDLKIKPGESMGDFSRRVNDALPMGRAKSGGPSRGALRTAKKRARMEAEVAAARQKRIERGEDNGGDDDDPDGNDIETSGNAKWNDRGTKRNKSGKREVSPDPWGHLKKPAPKFGDVVDRPPELKLSAKMLSNVPKAAGSMAKRFMLQDERQKVIDGYRALMESKRGTAEE